MAKKKTKKTPMLPKQLAGVEIPKSLRKQANHLAELARHPLVADIVAAGLVALAAKVSSSAKAKKAGRKVAEVVQDAGEAVVETVTASDSPEAPPATGKAPRAAKSKAVEKTKPAEKTKSAKSPTERAERRAALAKATTH